MPTTACFEYEYDLHPAMAVGLSNDAVQRVATLVASDLTLLPALSELLRADTPPSQGRMSDLFRSSRGGKLQAGEAALAYLIDMVYDTNNPDELKSRRGAVLELLVLAIIAMRSDISAAGGNIVHNVHDFALRPGGKIVSRYSADFAVCIPTEQRVEFYGCQLKAHNVESQELINLDDLCRAFLVDNRRVAGVFCTLDRERTLRAQSRERFSHYPIVRLYTSETLPDLRLAPPATAPDS